MARFYFDISDSDGFHPDDVGDEFADFAEARAQCQSILPDIVREELPDGDLHSVVCTVRDQTGRVVYQGELTFKGMVLA